MLHKNYAIALVFALSGIMLTACVKPHKSEEAIKSDIKKAEEDLKNAKAELNAEFPAFKKEANNKINENDLKISRLKAELNKPGKLRFDDQRKRKIADLEEKNLQMKGRIEAYERDHSDWVIFKREFNHDMESLGNAFNDLGEINTK